MQAEALCGVAGEAGACALRFWKSLSSLPLEAAKPTAFLGPTPVANQHVLGALLSTVLTLSLSVPSEIFPYLVVVIGLENVLVLTKSVVSTPVDLEVKLRIAQGNAAGSGGALGGPSVLGFLLWRGQGAPEIALALTSGVAWRGPPGPGGVLARALRNHRTAGLDFVLGHVSVRAQPNSVAGLSVRWPSVQTGTWCFLFLPPAATLGPGSRGWALQRRCLHSCHRRACDSVPRAGDRDAEESGQRA